MSDRFDLGRVFDAAADAFALWAPTLWDPLGAPTVDVAAPSPGERVLDACCGAGSSAIPAARAVGPGGLVDAVDLSERLLHQGRLRAAAAGLSQLRFVQADVSAWRPLDDTPYDVVQCVFGVFFLPDLDAAAEHLIGLLRPGGRLVVATWQRGCLNPVLGPFFQAVQAIRDPDAPPAGSGPAPTSSRVDTSDGLSGWLAGLGLTDPTVIETRLALPLLPESAWAFVTGAATRALIEPLSSRQRQAVRERFLDQLEHDGVETLRASALIARGIRPAQR